MVLGVGSFAHSIGGALADSGAAVSTYLTREYGPDLCRVGQGR